MKVRTIQADRTASFKEQFEKHQETGFSPEVAILFSSVEIDFVEIAAFLLDKGISLFGASSCGEFVFCDTFQSITEGGLVCVLLEIDPDSFKIRAFDKNGGISLDMGHSIGEWATGVFADPALLIVASGLDTDGEQLVRGIQEVTGKEITMFGGLAGDDAQFKETFAFTGDQVIRDGAVVMILDKSRYDVHGMATSGWVGIGAEKVVTKSDGNIVYTIDDMPALDVYVSYLNVDEQELPQIGVEYPLLLKKTGGEDVLRAVVNVDHETRALIFAGSVPQGSVVSFSSSPGFEIIETTKKHIEEFYSFMSQTDLLILFSCMARHSALGPTISEEIMEVWQYWRKPLVGFFTYGEIGNHYQAACDFHNETFTMVSIRDKGDEGKN
jgi:small ligand-binding sensory domain FIST